MTSHQWSAFVCFGCLLYVSSVLASTCKAETKYYDWEIAPVTYTRNCYTKTLLAVNGLYPGPTVTVNEGDRVIIKVKNSGSQNVSIHWHGIRQLRSCWADGVGYITECPIQPGNYEIYDFIVTGQRGTTLWHAHVGWLRATVYGAFITLPASGNYPFQQPDGEFPIMLGEWWNQDAEAVEQQALAAGGAFQLADALTINGFPGVLYNCSDTEGVTTIEVESGKTYMLRVINAALNTELFFAIANHALTVVEVDSYYSKPLTVKKGIVIAPGQTVNVLVTADQPSDTYCMVGQPHSTLLVTDVAAIPPPALPFVLQDVPYISTSGFFRYKDATVKSSCSFFPDLPAVNDTDYSTSFATGLKTLHPEKVPRSHQMRHLFYTVGTGTEPCTTCAPQQGGYRVTGQVNNISFVSPTTAILNAYYYKIPGVYTPDFPDFPLHPYDYAAAPSPPNPAQVAQRATRVSVLEHGSVVQLVLQDVNNFAFEAHPFHLHGHFFYVMGQGYGDYNGTSDPKKFNYYDPPSRFTVNVPARGWVAIRFLADNPGAWLFHCHFEKHLSWGMEAVFIVKDGEKRHQKLPAPKRKLNPC